MTADDVPTGGPHTDCFRAADTGYFGVVMTTAVTFYLFMLKG